MRDLEMGVVELGEIGSDGLHLGGEVALEGNGREAEGSMAQERSRARRSGRSRARTRPDVS